MGRMVASASEEEPDCGLYSRPEMQIGRESMYLYTVTFNRLNCYRTWNFVFAIVTCPAALPSSL